MKYTKASLWILLCIAIILCILTLSYSLYSFEGFQTGGVDLTTFPKFEDDLVPGLTHDDVISKMFMDDATYTQTVLPIQTLRYRNAQDPNSPNWKTFQEQNPGVPFDQLVQRKINEISYRWRSYLPLQTKLKALLKKESLAYVKILAYLVSSPIYQQSFLPMMKTKAQNEFIVAKAMGVNPKVVEEIYTKDQIEKQVPEAMRADKGIGSWQIDVQIPTFQNDARMDTLYATYSWSQFDIVESYSLQNNQKAQMNARTTFFTNYASTDLNTFLRFNTYEINFMKLRLSQVSGPINQWNRKIVDFPSFYIYTVPEVFQQFTTFFTKEIPLKTLIDLEQENSSLFQPANIQSIQFELPRKLYLTMINQSKEAVQSTFHILLNDNAFSKVTIQDLNASLLSRAGKSYRMILELLQNYPADKITPVRDTLFYQMIGKDFINNLIQNAVQQESSSMTRLSNGEMMEDSSQAANRITTQDLYLLTCQQISVKPTTPQVAQVQQMVAENVSLLHFTSTMNNLSKTAKLYRDGLPLLIQSQINFLSFISKSIDFGKDTLQQITDLVASNMDAEVKKINPNYTLEKNPIEQVKLISDRKDFFRRLDTLLQTYIWEPKKVGFFNTMKQPIREDIVQLRNQVRDMSGVQTDLVKMKNQSISKQKDWELQCTANLDESCKRLADSDLRLWDTIDMAESVNTELIEKGMDLDTQLVNLSDYQDMFHVPITDLSGFDALNDLGYLEPDMLRDQLNQLSPQYISPDAIDKIVDLLVGSTKKDKRLVNASNSLRNSQQVLLSIRSILGI